MFGIGCVGLSVLQGALQKQCSRIFAIDINESKESWAKHFGASESNDLLKVKFTDHSRLRMSAATAEGEEHGRIPNG